MPGTGKENSPLFRASCFGLNCACAQRVKTGLVSLHIHLVFIIQLPMQAPCFLSFKWLLSSLYHKLLKDRE